MRIFIHMGDSYPNEGPAAKRMKVFSQTLTEHGHKVIVLAPHNDSKDNKPENVYHCPTVKLKKKTLLRRMLNQVVFSITSIFVSLFAGPADVVLTTSPPALIGISGWIIAKIKRAKLVYDVRDIWPDVAWEMGRLRRDGFVSKVFQWVRDFMLKHADLVTTVSPGKIEKLRSYAPQAKISFITNGLDEQFLNNIILENIAEDFNLKTSFSCVYMGNLGWAQGLTQLLDIAQRAKEEKLSAKFYLFGSGVEENLLRSFAEEHELDNVVFAGRLPNQAMYTVLRNADMSFVSLVNENLKDSVPTKLFEALGVGCPVLLASVGDAADILNECRLGIAVRPNDSEALWNAFKEMYEHHDEYVLNREYAKNIVLAKYSRQKAAELLEGELLEIL